MEWQGEEYPYDEDYPYGECGKMSWIWNKGLGLGKKILFGGAVVSSAPLFLPPLVVISVLGVALSIPYGILLGSYACTEKVMSKLLPPPAPLFSGYGMVSYDDDGDECVGYGGVLDMERDEKGLMDDEEVGGGKDEVSGNFSYEPDVYEKHVWEYFDEEEDKRVPPEVNGAFDGMRKEDAEEIVLLNRVEGIAVVVEGDSLVGTILEEVVVEGDDLFGTIVEEVVTPCEETSIVVEQSINRLEGDGLERSDVEEVEIPCQATSILLEECTTQEGDDGIEDDELARGTRGLLERIRDEGRDDTEEEMPERARVVEEMELPIEVKHAYSSDVQMDKTTVEIGERSCEDVLRENEIEEIMRDQETRGTFAGIATEIEVKIASKRSDIMEAMSHEEVPGENEGMIETRYMETIETVEAVVSGFIEEEPKYMLEGEITGNNDGKDETEDSRLSGQRDTVIYPNADAQEIAGKNAAGERNSYSDYGIPRESEQSSHDIGFESRSSLEQPVSSRKDIGIDVPSNESPYNEPKIWEQIRAMRTIVGYKSAIHGTCIEELKALYIFTGIEPPASFQEPSDLVEVNEKLQFLMSIVGVK